MKRYLLFCGYNFYPYGGFRDFKSSHDTEQEAESEAQKYTKLTWYQVVDAESGMIVADGTINGSNVWS